jgi:integrase
MKKRGPEMFDLEAYKGELEKQVKAKKLSKETARYYSACVFEINRQFCFGEAMDAAEAIKRLCEDGTQGLKYIAAVKKYERDILDRPRSILYGAQLSELYGKYRARPIGRELSLPEETYLRKINRLGSNALKLALRLQAKSGLRIAEIAALAPCDIAFGPEGQIDLTVRSGKGGKRRTVSVMADEYLSKNLKAHMEGIPPDKRLFYAESYLRKKASLYRIKTHDLRRLNARMRFREQQEAGKGRRESRRETGRQLGHEKPIITSAYLGTEWEGFPDPDKGGKGAQAALKPIKTNKSILTKER